MKTGKKVTFAPTNNSSNNMKTVNTVKSTISLLLGLFLLAVNIVILVYLKKLNSEECATCFRDEHYNVIKGLTIYNIVSSIVLPLMYLFLKQNIYARVMLLFIMIINVGLSGWLAIVFTTYIYNLEKHNCPCLENKGIIGLHKFLRVWRYFMLTGFALSVGVIVVMLLLVIYKAFRG